MIKGIRQAVNKFFIQNTSAFWTGYNPTTWNKKALLNEYRNKVFPVVSAIAEDASKIEFTVHRKVRGKLEPVANHPFLELIAKPNPDFSQFQFLELHFTFLKLVGESFWYLAKGEKTSQPREIYLLRPDYVEVKVEKEDNPTGLVSFYEFRNDKGEKIRLEKNEILHFKMPNPKDPSRGLSPVEASRAYVETETFTATWTRNSVFNSGRPSSIVSVKGNIGDDQFRALKKEAKDQYSSPDNAGKIMFIRGIDGVDVKEMGMTLGEAGLRDIKDLNRDDIMMAYRVSKPMMGIFDDINRASAITAKNLFIESIVKPELDRLIDHLNAFFMPMWNQDVVLGYKDLTSVSREEQVEEWDKGLNKWLTINDIRQERGLEGVPGGDVIYQPLTLVPLSSKPEQRTVSTKKIIQKLNQKERTNRREVGEKFRKTLFSRAEPWVKKYQEQVNKEFKLQRSEILGASRAYKNNKKKQIENWFFDINASTNRLIGSLVPLTLDIMQDQSENAFDIVGVNPRPLDQERLRQIARERIERFANHTNDETLRLIGDSIGEGIAEGESIRDLRKRIEDIYGSAIENRSERIARTETIYASNESANETYRQLGVKQKEWLANPGACEFCQELDGTIIEINGTFLAEGETLTGINGGVIDITYDDKTHPPLHPNCRCTVIPVLGDDFNAIVPDSVEPQAQEVEVVEKQENEKSEKSEKQDIEAREQYLQELKKSYQEMDKRTSESKKLLEKIKEEREKLRKDRSEIKELMRELNNV